MGGQEGRDIGDIPRLMDFPHLWIVTVLQVILKSAFDGSKEISEGVMGDNIAIYRGLSVL